MHMQVSDNRLVSSSARLGQMREEAVEHQNGCLRKLIFGCLAFGLVCCFSILLIFIVFVRSIGSGPSLSTSSCQMVANQCVTSNVQKGWTTTTAVRDSKSVRSEKCRQSQNCRFDISLKEVLITTIVVTVLAIALVVRFVSPHHRFEFMLIVFVCVALTMISSCIFMWDGHSPYRVGSRVTSSDRNENVRPAAISVKPVVSPVAHAVQLVPSNDVDLSVADPGQDANTVRRDATTAPVTSDTFSSVKEAMR
jgi:hypothetical protein